MGSLDLNVDAEGYPQIQSYQHLLNASAYPNVHGLQPLRIRPAYDVGHFVPPRAALGEGGPAGARRGASRGRGGTRCSRSRAAAAAEDTNSMAGDEEDGYKAYWSNINTHVFCVLAVDHKRSGFTSNRTMTKRGFLSMAPYVGMKDGGAIDAPSWWWDMHTKVMWGMPTFFPFMEELFQTTVVDGSTSTIPRDSNYDDPRYDADGILEDEDAVDVNTNKDSMQTPRSTTSSRKRSFSTVNNATSPSKSLHVSKKASMASVMQGMVDQLEVVAEKDKKTLDAISENFCTKIKVRDEELKKKKLDKIVEVKECLNKIKELGLPNTSPKYLVATKLFKSGYNRFIFSHYDTPEERLEYLQSYCHSGNDKDR
ncbi:hypothetical protein SORBI_3008G114401 [Sorghum bicolor]|uniref:Uncharacterized protein n=1 Tax=Sorghum bicolor TaxID=4558 RepID=A0A1Z5R670_SORBI|nr:hypothetical protein SORBI_3008G114401 [Sorghum bicolor]